MDDSGDPQALGRIGPQCLPKAMVVKKAARKTPRTSRPVLPDATAEILKTLQECGRLTKAAGISYQKPGERWVTERRVEPYTITYANTGLIIRTWQLDPLLESPSWRSFRLDRIVSAAVLSDSFTPRLPVTLHLGKLERFKFFDEFQGTDTEVASLAQIYTEMLHSALADLDLTQTEQAELKSTSASLATEQIRAIHGRFFAEVLSEICADGRVTHDEIDRITAVRVWLTELGWCP